MFEDFTLEELVGWRQHYLAELFDIDEEIKFRLAGVKIGQGESISVDVMTPAKRTPTPPTIEFKSIDLEE